MAVALALVAMVGAVSAVTQTWYLSSDTTTGGNIMYRGDQSGATGNVQIEKGGSVIWLANENATVDLTFPVGDWSVTTQKSSATGSGEGVAFTASIGVYNATTTFSPKGSVSGSLSTSSQTFTIKDASSFTVHTGEWLALQITNTETRQGNRKFNIVTSASASYVTQPETTFTYPIPELATIVLFGAGLLALVGYIAYRKRS